MVFPTDKKIRNNRHQNPTPSGSSSPGDICIFQDSLSDWTVGTDCREILARTINWFEKYENGLLDQEPSPPEIERYYSDEYLLRKPKVVIAETLTDFNDEKCGKFAWLPTQSGNFTFVATLGKKTSDYVINELSRLMTIVMPHERVDLNGFATGFWYLIEEEPFSHLPKSSSDLIELISTQFRNRSLKSITMQLADDLPRYIALCYPARFDNIHWLIYEFALNIPARTKGIIRGFRWQSQYRAILGSNKNTKVTLLPVHHLSKRALFRRASGLSLDVLGKSKVMVIGCGTLGSRVIDLLVKSGVENLKIVDNDTLKIGNVVRHVLGLEQIGLNKADGMKSYALERNPFIQIETFNADIRSDEGSLWLERSLEDVGLVVSCIGDDAVKSWINQAAMLRGKPVMFCRAYAHATIGEILLAIPKRLCFSCMSDLLAAKKIDIPQPPQLSFEEMVRFDDADCGATFIPGSAVDTDLIALHCSRIAIDFLQSKQTDENYWLVRGRSFAENNKWEIDTRLENPYIVLNYSLSPLASCPICGYRIIERK